MNVKFDGKHISFPVNGIVVVDGKFPDSLTIGENECYQIDGRSLALLTAFLNEKSLVELKTHDIIENEYKCGSIGMSFNMRDLCRIFSRDSYVVELIQKLEKREKELADIKRIIDSHNEQSWYDRIERIHYNSEE